MSEAKSFIGEYSVGLSIVPCIKEVLHEKYKYVTPIFPWATREGSNISKYLHRSDYFQILGLFPRRPKLTSESEDIEFKINVQVIAGAYCGLKLGIPIIAGCPLVKNFWELSDNPRFIWIRLELNKNADFMIKIKEKESLTPVLANILFNKNQDILDYINEKAKFFSIEQALKAFREVKMATLNLPFHSRFVFGGVYKPIYFLLK
jgi:hypothetical protein